jgi:hypothetical protein
LIDSIAVNVTGNTFKTYTENWTNVDTIVVASTCDKTQHICDITLDPQDFNANWGSGTLYMDNVVIDNSVGVPGPIAGAGLPGLIAACGGLLALARRRRQRQAVAS